ncbi:MAG: hypothetical protein E3K40_11670 [Candidatus Brocadia sp.]|nr:hypothetical protein [Candidatus Brocadia sp.]
MIKFPKFQLRKSIPIIGIDKQGIGRVPVQVARELVKTKHAELIRNHPSVIGLRHIGNKAVSPGRVVSTSPLKNLIHTASLFASKNSRSAILNSVLFRIEGHTLRITSTDMETYFTGCLKPDTNYSFTHDTDISGICINARYLGKILSSQNNNLSLHIVKGKDYPAMRIGEFFLEGEDASRFPDIQFHKKEGKVYKGTLTDIATKLKFVGQAISKNMYRSALCGIYFDLKNRQLVGADGNRLHTVSMSDTNGRVGQNKDDICVILPTKLLQASKLIAGNITVVDNGEQQYAMFDLNVPGCVSCTGVYNAIEGQYPNYRDVIPKEGFISKFMVRTKDLILALHKARIAIGNSYDKTLACEFKNGMLIVSIQRMGRLIYQGVVRGEHHGPSYCGQINVDYLSDAVLTMPGDLIEIMLQGKKDEAWTIRNQSGFTAIVMPIGLENGK